MVNPQMKNNEFRIIERKANLFCSMSFISSSETPEIKRCTLALSGAHKETQRRAAKGKKPLEIPTFCNQNLIFL